MEKEPEKNKNTRKWLALVNIPAQMGVIIYLFYFVGHWLDENHPNDSVYFAKLLPLIGSFVAIYNVIRQVNELNNSE